VVGLNNVCRCVRLGLLGLLLVPVVWVSAQQMPDLIVKSIVLDPPVLRAGQTVTIRAEVVNDNRAASVEGRFDVLFKLDGQRIANQPLILSATASRTTEIRWQATEGTHTLSVEVDRPRDQIKESNERNNTLEVTFSVAPDTSVLSFTHTALSAQAAAWEQASLALTFNTSSTNVTLLLNLLQAGFDDFAKAMRALASTLKTLKEQALPQFFGTDDFFSALFVPYDDIDRAAFQVQKALKVLDFNNTVEGMKAIETSLRQLAAQASPVLPLARLEAAADNLKAAVEAAVDANALLNDPNAGDASDPIGRLLSEVSALGETLTSVAQVLAQSVTTNSARFTDAQGQPLRLLGETIDVVINVPGQMLTFELVNDRGTQQVQRSDPGNRLGWDGTDNAGKRLSSQTYFYRVRWVDGAATTLADVGTLTLGN